MFGQSIHALVDAELSDDTLVAPLVARGIVVESVRKTGATLEDVFVDLTLLRRRELEVAA